MNAPCARCNKPVYPVEKMTCLDKVSINGRCTIRDSLHLATRPDVAQGLLQLRVVRTQVNHENLQGLQQTAILRYVSVRSLLRGV